MAWLRGWVYLNFICCDSVSPNRSMNSCRRITEDVFVGNDRITWIAYIQLYLSHSITRHLPTLVRMSHQSKAEFSWPFFLLSLFQS